MSGTRVRRRGPGSRADEHHPTRRELVNAAAIVAERDGLAALSVDSVTRTAGHAKGTFYVHFADRSELLIDLHRRFHEELFQRIRESSAAIPAGPERARMMITSFLDGCRQQVGVRSMLLQARGLPEIADLARQRNAEAAREVASNLSAATPTPLETAQLLVGATVEIALQELHAGKRLPRLRSALMYMVPD